MKDTISYSLSSQGFKDNYLITELGQIIDTASQTELVPNRKGQYSLKTKDNKTVHRCIKPIYRKAFKKEYCVDRIPDLEGEQWKPIDRTGKYYVSNYGRVKSYQKRTALLLKPYTNQKGYYRVDIQTTQRKSYLVHQLVALAFIPNDNPIEKDTVDHINLNKKDNTVSNLRWLSRGDNARAYSEQIKKKVQANNGCS